MKLTSEVGGRLAEQWIASILSPAFVFWSAGIFVAVDKYIGWPSAIRWLSAQDDYLLLVLTIVLFVNITLSGFVVQRLDFHVLRLLEGYVPSWLSGMRNALIARRKRKIERAEVKYKELAAIARRTPSQTNELLDLEIQLEWVPPDPVEYMPTQLGNILRAAETRPRSKYGLDAVICWPRLWLLLPNPARKEIDNARTALDSDAQLFAWGVLVLGWSLVSPWAILVSVAVMVYAYHRMLGSARNFGELIDTAFDLYRMSIYRALGWPQPANPQEEYAMGMDLVKYIKRGSDSPAPAFVFEVQNDVKDKK